MVSQPPDLVVDNDETVSVNDGDEEAYSSVDIGGTLNVGGDLVIGRVEQDGEATAADIDSTIVTPIRLRPARANSADTGRIEVTSQRDRDSVATAADQDTAVGIAIRERVGGSTASDIDTAAVTSSRERAGVATISDDDTGSATSFYIPNTTETTPAEAIAFLLDAASILTWQTNPPNVYKWWNRSQSERGPGQGQPPELYVSSLTGAPIDRISADGALLQEEPTVEIWVYTLSESDTAQLARDVIQFMSEYMDNQEANGPFVDIVPSNVEDFREQKLAQHTDHFVYQVELSLERLSNTGVA